MVDGDFVTPNNWAYQIRWLRYWKGARWLRYKANQNFERREGPHGPGFSDAPATPSWTTTRTLVYNRTLEKLNSRARGDLDLGIALAELGTTKRMIKGLNKVFQFSKVHRLGSTKDLANGYLEFSYGWAPLLSDVFGIADEMLNVVVANLQKVRASVRVPFEVDQTVKQQVSGLTNVPTRHRGKGKTACTIQVHMKVPDSLQLSRWSSLNPVSLGWEIIPYSFVVDWFYDVGSYLRAYETALLYNTEFVDGFVSELFVADGSQVIVDGFYKDFGTYVYTFEDMEQFYRLREFSRTKLTSWPLPRKPTFQVDLGWRRLTSAASLLRQLLK